MGSKSKILLILTVLFLIVNGSVTAATVSVGVKKGDWIEYQVTTTGTPTEGHDVTWARMEILNIQGTEISVNVTTKALNGTFESMTMTLNPAKGEVGIWFIIPANLNVGEEFFDASTGKNVTIEGSEQRAIAGATRTVTHATTPERIKSWDKATGVFVESVDTLSNYTLHAIVDKTNLWNEQLFGMDPPLFYGVILAVAGAATIATFFAAISRRNRSHQDHSKTTASLQPRTNK